MGINTRRQIEAGPYPVRRPRQGLPCRRPRAEHRINASSSANPGWRTDVLQLHGKYFAYGMNIARGCQNTRAFFSPIETEQRLSLLFLTRVLFERRDPPRVQC